MMSELALIIFRKAERLGPALTQPCTVGSEEIFLTR